MNEKPSETPRPWLTHSAWSISPFLFLLELFGFAGAFWILVNLGIWGNPFWVIPAVVGFCAYQTGRRCVIDGGERVPRVRLWGTAALVSLIHGGFLFLITHNQLPSALEAMLRESPELLEELRRADPALADFTPEALAAPENLALFTTALLITTFLVGAFLFLLHAAFLIAGARRTERRLLTGEKP